jgi:hypothetical protein
MSGYRPPRWLEKTLEWAVPPRIVGASLFGCGWHASEYELVGEP